MNDPQHPYEPPRAELTPPTEPAPPPLPRARMHPVLKGCLIALLIAVGLVLLAVGACFALLASSIRH